MSNYCKANLKSKLRKLNALEKYMDAPSEQPVVRANVIYKASAIVAAIFF